MPLGDTYMGPPIPRAAALPRAAPCASPAPSCRPAPPRDAVEAHTLPSVRTLRPVRSRNAYHIGSPPARGLVTPELAEALETVAERFARERGFTREKPLDIRPLTRIQGRLSRSRRGRRRPISSLSAARACWSGTRNGTAPRPPPSRPPTQERRMPRCTTSRHPTSATVCIGHYRNTAAGASIPAAGGHTAASCSSSVRGRQPGAVEDHADQ